MTDHKAQLIAYLATLAALVGIIAAVLFAMSKGVTVTESIGVSIAIGGLIGVLRLPQARGVHVENPPDDPVPVEPGSDRP